MAKYIKKKNHASKEEKKRVKVIIGCGVAATVVLLLLVAVMISKTVDKKLQDGQTEYTDQAITLGMSEYEMRSGLRVQVPNWGEEVDASKVNKNLSYLETRYNGNVPKYAYGIIETPIVGGAVDMVAENAVILEAVNKDIKDAVGLLTKGGQFSPASTVDIATLGNMQFISQDADFTIIAATLMNNYIYPEGVKLDPETGEPAGTKPDGTPWTKDDAVVKQETVPVDVSSKAKICTTLIGDRYVTVWCMWSESLKELSEETVKALVSGACGQLGQLNNLDQKAAEPVLTPKSSDDDSGRNPDDGFVPEEKRG